MCRCVSVPERFSLIFSKAEKVVADYFDGITRNSSLWPCFLRVIAVHHSPYFILVDQGTIVVPERDAGAAADANSESEPKNASTAMRASDRYMLLCGDSVGVGFFSLLKKTFTFRYLRL